jgi:excisionase family DNA binding protein
MTAQKEREHHYALGLCLWLKIFGCVRVGFVWGRQWLTLGSICFFCRTKMFLRMVTEGEVEIKEDQNNETFLYGKGHDFYLTKNFTNLENPFELILDKLNNIENLLKTVMQNDNGTVTITEVLNLNQAAEYVSLSKSAIYKKTSERNIPHFKKGKKLYFKKGELDHWLTSMKISTKDEIEQAATDYIIKKGKFRF